MPVVEGDRQPVEQLVTGWANGLAGNPPAPAGGEASGNAKPLDQVHVLSADPGRVVVDAADCDRVTGCITRAAAEHAAPPALAAVHADPVPAAMIGQPTYRAARRD